MVYFCRPKHFLQTTTENFKQKILIIPTSYVGIEARSKEYVVVLVTIDMESK